MVLRVDEELVEEALGFVGNIAVVLLVEAGCEDSVGKFALVTPVLWKVRQKSFRKGLNIICLPS